MNIDFHWKQPCWRIGVTSHEIALYTVLPNADRAGSTGKHTIWNEGLSRALFAYPLHPPYLHSREQHIGRGWGHSIELLVLQTRSSKMLVLLLCRNVHVSLRWVVSFATWSRPIWSTPIWSTPIWFSTHLVYHSMPKTHTSPTLI